MSNGDLTPALFQPERGLYLAPVRHHSPACAWALRQMIAEVQPAHVLIEGPADLSRHIPLLTDPACRPPVALVTLRDAKTRAATYYPFTAHSPEYVALQAAAELGAAARFIDLPSSAHAGEDTPRAQPLTQKEHHFDSGSYVAALCRKTGCRDGFALWDHLFEARAGTADWRGFFTDVGTYCAGIRAATPEPEIAATGDHARETHMSGEIAKALAQKDGPVVVVIGGFHAPALTGPQDTGQQAKAESQSYLIRYSYPAMDALAGYGAGLPQPGYYDALWTATLEADGPPDWTGAPAALVDGFSAAMAEEGHRLSLPAKVEALRMAQGLAQMRGRAGALRHDLMDGIIAAVVKGEQGAAEIWHERLYGWLRGTKLGDVPAAAGQPPLVEDARRRARAHKFDISDSAERQRKLDIRRKDSQLAASRFAHAMTLLETGFARREAGPDYVQGHRTDLLFEEWRYVWTPQVELRLVQASAQADTVPGACLAHLYEARAVQEDAGEVRDLAVLVDLLMQGILAGLGAELAAYLDGITSDIRRFGRFETVAHALQRLYLLGRATGPLSAPDGLDVAGATVAAYDRLVFLVDDLPKVAPEKITAHLGALRLMNEVLQDGSDLFDPAPYWDALDRVTRPGTPPDILGAILSLSVLGGQRDGAELATALEGSFQGSVLSAEDRIGVLRGLLAVAPQLLWLRDDVLGPVDTFLTEMDEAAFLDLLPHLRLAFTGLNPRETDRLAALVAARHGGDAAAYTAHVQHSERAMQQGVAANKALLAELAQDGLIGWMRHE